MLIRSAAEAKLREADRLDCEAWNAIMWAGGPAMPSPGDPQAVAARLEEDDASSIALKAGSGG